MTGLPAFLVRNWQASAGILFAIILASMLAVRTSERDEARHALASARAEHALFTAQVRASSAMAESRFTERARRAEREQAEINQEASHDYQARMRDLDRRVAALRMRERAPRANRGGAGQSAVPSLSDATGRADGAAGDHGLSLDERAAATAQAMRLEALQEWIRRQSEVRPPAHE